MVETKAAEKKPAAATADKAESPKETQGKFTGDPSGRASGDATATNDDPKNDNTPQGVSVEQFQEESEELADKTIASLEGHQLSTAAGLRLKSYVRSITR